MNTDNKKRTNPWIEAMRLRTLPVSLAGVTMAAALSLSFPKVKVIPLILCLLFALLAQIASNFANEYYDYRDGLDKPGRVGPRRGVSEGDITPRAMKRATFLTLALACADGLMLVPYGGWWLILAGIAIAAGVLAYSTGPYPFSRHALGEAAVVFYFGIIPVNLTCRIAAGEYSMTVFLASVAIGLMGANVIIVNNYRDMEADREVGKKTLPQILGARGTQILYLLNAVTAAVLLLPFASEDARLYIPIAFYLCLTLPLWIMLLRKRGRALNPLLGKTAVTMFLTSLLFLGFML